MAVVSRTTRLRAAVRALLPAIVACAGGASTALAFPGWDAEPLVWIGPAAVLLAVWWGAGRARVAGRRPWLRGAVLGYLAGLSFFLLNLGWIRTVSIAGSIALPAYLSLYWAGFGAFAATVGRPEFRERDEGSLFRGAPRNLAAAALNAAAWVGLEWLRGVAFTGFGWNGLGVALWRNLTMIQAADLVGVTGLAFVVVFVASAAAGLLVRIVRRRSPGRIRIHLDFAVAVLLVVATFLYGFSRLRGHSSGESAAIPVRLLVVQPNIPQDEKWNPGAAREIYRRLADTTAAFLGTIDLDLVVWPETALPQPLDAPGHDAFVNGILAESRNRSGTHLLFGTNEDAVTEGFFNSIALVRGEWTDRAIYRKIHLVAFGEYIPLREAFPPFEWIAGGIIPWDFDRGSSTEPLTLSLPDGTIGLIPAICFEDTLGRQLRRFIRDTPQMIVNVTNDGWFLRSPASRQHLANAVFRCVELRRPMVRSANTGVSAVIDETGRFHDRQAGGAERVIADPETGSTFIEGSLTTVLRVPASPPVTVYAAAGDLFSQLAGALALTAAVVQAIRNRTGRRRTHAGTAADSRLRPS